MITADLERVRSALFFLSADMPRDDWVEIAMAVKAELGEGGFDLFDEWSRQSDRYIARGRPGHMEELQIQRWHQRATLFFRAKAVGWRDDGTYQKPTAEELSEWRRIAAERASREEAEKARERAQAASKAQAIWKAATPAGDDHPYLARKRVCPVPSLREVPANKVFEILGYAPASRGETLAGRLLVVPIKSGGELSTVELIDEAGRKSSPYGGAKAGGYWEAQALPDGDGAGLTLLIGEGGATVLSAKEATAYPAIAALSCGNLEAVAKAMRERFPGATLMILADLTKAIGEPDPHAIEAARAIGGLVAVPDFGENRPEGLKDFNDLAVHRGMEAVRAANSGR